MPERYARIIAAFRDTPWAILPGHLAAIRDVLAFRASGERLSAEEIRERLGIEAGADQALRVRAAQTARNEGGGKVAVIPLRGIIAHRMAAMDDVSGPGGTSTERFAQSLRAALADDTVGSILIDADSPGGSVDGVEELAREVFEARGQKPIIAVVNTLAASAAYWIVSAADEIAVTPSGEVGSIGVFAAHTDVSGLEEKLGVKTTLIHAGKFKVEAHGFAPLDDDARAAIQGRVDEHYTMFVDAVARGRDVSAASVRGGFGEGRVVGAAQAVSLGMADRVATLDDEIARALAPADGAAARNRAHAEAALAFG